MLVAEQTFELQDDESEINEEERRESEPNEEAVDPDVLVVVAEVREDALLEAAALAEVQHYQIHHVKLNDAHHEADQRDIRKAGLQAHQRQHEDRSPDHPVQQPKDCHEVSHTLLFCLHSLTTNYISYYILIPK